MITNSDFSERDQQYGKALKFDFEQMSVEDLWHVREELTRILSKKLNEEKGKLELRLSTLSGGSVGESTEAKPERRAYPIVPRKYRDPTNPAQTWSGRGKQPGWVVVQLRSGKKLQDLLI
jgi:DNA-binding protein H-NS